MLVYWYHLNKPGQTRSGRSPDRARCGSVGRPATAPQLIEKIRILVFGRLATNIPIYRSTGLPIYRSTDLPIYRSTSLPAYRSTGPSPRLAAKNRRPPTRCGRCRQDPARATTRNHRQRPAPPLLRKSHHLAQLVQSRAPSPAQRAG
ncbi:MAG TPA: hypothetical protein ENN19_12130 [Chloroflexi bacterium]|nr:hypothetical protein [Chloroflexota bacterium]